MKAVHQQGVFDGLIEVAAGFDHIRPGCPGPGPDGDGAVRQLPDLHKDGPALVHPRVGGDHVLNQLSDGGGIVLVADANRQLQLPLAFGGIIDDIALAQLAVGHIDQLVVHSGQSGVDKADQTHRPLCAAQLHIIPRLKGLGVQHKNPSGDVGQSILHGQGQSQAEDAQ